MVSASGGRLTESLTFEAFCRKSTAQWVVKREVTTLVENVLPDSPQFTLDDTRALARVAHDGQVDKLGVAYIQHVEAVAAGLVAELLEYAELDDLDELAGAAVTSNSVADVTGAKYRRMP